MCTKFQPDWSMHMQVIAIFSKVFKKKKKQTNSFGILIAHILGMAEGFSSNLECGLPWVEGIYIVYFCTNWVRHHRAMNAWKSWLSCSCQNTHSIYVHPIFLGRMTHSTVCIDISMCLCSIHLVYVCLCQCCHTSHVCLCLYDKCYSSPTGEHDHASTWFWYC